MKANTIFTIILTIISFSCQRQSLLRETLTEAGSNSSELQSVIDSFDGDMKEVAEYTVGAIWGHRGRTGPGIDSLENLYRELPGAYSWWFDPSQLIRGKRYAAMPLSESKDSEVLTADYLKHNIYDAYRLLNTRPWNQDLPREIFCEMILPYRIGDEPLTEWRPPYREWLRDIEDKVAGCASSVDAARIIASHIGSCHYNDQLSTPHRSALNLLNTPIGYCREDCDRTVYAMRAMGVPVTIDMMLVSPENGASHSWTVVWDNIDRMMRMFDNGVYLPTRDSVHYDHRRKGKIYRQTFAPDFGRIKRYQSADNPPAVLLNPWLKDVTSEYFGHNKVTVEIWPKAGLVEYDAIYLGVFAGQRFQPIDIAEQNGTNAVFTDIEPNLIYAPITADGTVCGYPFLLDGTCHVHYLKGNEQNIDHVRLTRKFPLRFLHRERLASIVGMHVQSGPTAYGPWHDIEIIRSSPDHSYRRITMNGSLQHRYIRLFKPSGTNALVDQILACRDTLGLNTLPLSVTGDASYNRLLKAGYTVALEPGAEDCIVHVDSEDPITSLFILPSNDDNFVVPAQEYELLYFAGPKGWESLGRKISTGFSIEFDAPHGALLWLRNLTKGKEEQIFIYKDSCQLFNIDLHDFSYH